jgi:ethanolamine utilization protein EutN
MFVAKVIGNMVCTHKDDNLKGLKLLIVQPVDEGMLDRGKPLVAIDTLGQSGEGDLVYLAKSKESRFSPIRCWDFGDFDYFNVTNEWRNNK